ncbi:MAG: hypothetical protein ACI4F0_11425 [Agathobacter sp.]
MEFVLIVVAVWFIAVFWGIRKILSMSKLIHNIKVGNMKIVIKKVARIEILNNAMFDNNCRIKFWDGSYTMVLQKYEKLLKVGDECYVVYIGNSDEIYHIYNTKKYQLDEELSKIFQRGEET